jgi:hypothetical protein
MADASGPDHTAGAADRGPLAYPRTFLVRLGLADSGAVTGVVEAVRTGEKRRFEGTQAIGAVIDGMLALRESSKERFHRDAGSTESTDEEIAPASRPDDNARRADPGASRRVG